MTELSVQPLLPSEDIDESVAFYQALGFEIVRNETFPYRFAEFRDSDLWLLTSSLAPFGGKKAFGAFIVTVAGLDQVHDRYAGNLRQQLGSVPLRGLPRLTRRSRDGSQFRLFDPAGNMLVYMDKQYAPPLYLDAPEPIDDILNQVWFLRDVYANDAAAAKVLDRALTKSQKRGGIDRARLLGARAEIAIAMGKLHLAAELEEQIHASELSDSDAVRFEDELAASHRLRAWAGIGPPAGT
jgi:catechol 2,3-dioxygenase-like lactoylglutathione lyase family enzyme